jgi:hypothetical protein
MSGFPNFSNVAPYARAELDRRIANPIETISGLNAWVRIASGVDAGLILYSNPNFTIFEAAGDRSIGTIYGNQSSSGTIGVTWDGRPYIDYNDLAFRPKPNVTSIEIDEGAGNLSRKAKFTITAYTPGQLNELCKFFLEPGFTIFLEWGWNERRAMNGFEAISVPYVAKNQSFKNVNQRREETGGLYDNYLGFITGGSIAISGQFWEINVECTGFTELPAYFLAADNTKPDQTPEELEEAANEFDPAEISAQTDLGLKRFMMMYNQLPSNRRTDAVYGLIKDTKEVAHVVNFINFDESVREEMNNQTDGWAWGIFENSATVGSESVSFPSGTEIIGPDKFIRFGTLMKIINAIGIDHYVIGGKKVKMQVNTERTVVSAFPKIFSCNKSKLFIPNPKTPKFDLVNAIKTKTPQKKYSEVLNNSVVGTSGGKALDIHFPSKGAITDNQTYKGILSYKDSTIESLNVPGEHWGFLDDLYVNFDFVKGILETKNFYVKDALYQILNGMASAAGGIWDYQIIETTDPKNPEVTELVVVDLNLKNNAVPELPIAFDVYGNKSIFMDASLDLNISGAKMNQIIAQRLSNNVNSSQPPVVGKLFAKNLKDKILTAIKRAEASPFPKKTPSTAAGNEDEEKLKEKNLQLFLNKVGIFPKVMITKDTVSDKISDQSYIASLDDLSLFESIKVGSDERLNKTSVSILFPINFTFTIHGISGIKRGDKFRIKGIPEQYETGGFFQVLSVKHTITDMTWKTEISGGFRQLPSP